jgi:NADH:ubiquinone oxidoreductase subunit F (NADH-binding)
MTITDPRRRTATPAGKGRTPVPAPDRLPRLLAEPTGPGLVDHLDLWGPGGRLDLDEVGRAGLRGRGGAGFPTAHKLAAVRRSAGVRGRTPVVVANGTEGEPASAKDAALLEHRPHLVLDGVAAAAAALGADRAVLCVSDDDDRAARSALRAIGERRGLDRIAVELVRTPEGYVSGEESALVRWLDGGPALPTVTPPRPSDRGVSRRPTLVENVETLAHLALIARFGGGWWRGVGTADDPGTTLVTVSGGVERPGVYEVASGTDLGGLLRSVGAGPTAGVLVGGYFGTWLSPERIDGTGLGRAPLARLGGSPGCGVVAVLPAGSCPLAETARVAAWLAGQSAGQCGPCVHGLPALAGALGAMVDGDPDGRAEAQLHRWSAMVRGRGACRLPDGAVGLVQSALAAFGGHLELHRSGRRCAEADRPPVLPVPPRARRAA